MSWDDLSMREKAAMMRVAVKNKIFEIDKIKEAYNNLDRLVSNSEVINPNLYTPSVNLNINPALDYVGNALESISGYEYEGNPLNKLGIDMSFDLGTTGSSMYPNGIRFVKKFAEGGLSEGGGSYVPEKIKLESRPYIPSVKNVTDFTGNPLDNPTDLYYYDGKPLYLSTLNNMFGEDNYRVLKYDNGDVFIEPKFVETEMTIPELLVGAKMPELVKQQLDELEEKQLLLYWESPALTQGGEFKLNQPSTMSYISSLIDGMKTPAEIQAMLNAHKEQAKEMIEWFPFVGDAIEGYDMAKDVYTDIKDGDYLGASGKTAAGLALVFAPKILSELGTPIIKKGKQWIKGLLEETNEYIKDVKNYKDTYNLIKEGRYKPLMTKKLKDRLRLEHYTLANSVLKDVLKTVDTDIRVGGERIYWNPSMENPEWPDKGERFIELDFDIPHVEVVDYMSKKGIAGNYNYDTRTVNIPMFRGHKAIPSYDNINTVFHEGGHDLVWQFSPTLHDFTKVFDDYYSINDLNDEAVEIFSPLLRNNKAGSWESSPDEFLAELIGKKGERGIFRPMNESEKLDISSFMSTRFNISLSEANKMLDKLLKYGFKHGGKINRF